MRSCDDYDRVSEYIVNDITRNSLSDEMSLTCQDLIRGHLLQDDEKTWEKVTGSLAEDKIDQICKNDWAKIFFFNLEKSCNNVDHPVTVVSRLL